MSEAQWTGYIRGFGEYLGNTVYETIELARKESALGERIYQITHVETVMPAPRQEQRSVNDA